MIDLDQATDAEIHAAIAKLSAPLHANCRAWTPDPDKPGTGACKHGPPVCHLDGSGRAFWPWSLETELCPNFERSVHCESHLIACTEALQARNEQRKLADEAAELERQAKLRRQEAEAERERQDAIEAEQLEQAAAEASRLADAQAQIGARLQQEAKAKRSSLRRAVDTVLGA